jgi:hypothetical protein
MSGEGSSPEGKLLVFLHVAVKQRALQSELQAALGHVVVTAVGRIGDFDRALHDGQDAVLTLPVVLEAHGLTAKVRGRRKGSPDEKYALVGVDAPPDPAKVAVVGALDLLGRQGTTDFVQRLLDAKPKVERVIKVEDLLSLLQMQRVEAIVLPARLVDALKTASRLNLAQRELAASVGLPAVCALGPRAGDVLAALNRLPMLLSGAMGVDEWR